MKNQDELIAQAGTLIQMGEKVLSTETADNRLKPLVNEQKFHDFRISALSFLTRVFGEGSTYSQSLKSEVTQPTASRTRRGIGILAAAQRDLRGNWLETTTGAISRDILLDMLRLAKIQADQGYNIAAIIIAGSLLEKALRNLCLTYGLPIHNEIQNKAIPKRGLQLTGELYKKKAYTRQENKAILGWLELYNNAVEEKVKSITAAEAKDMLNGLLTLFTKMKY